MMYGEMVILSISYTEGYEIGTYNNSNCLWQIQYLISPKKYLKCPDRVVLKMVKMMHYGLNDAIGKIVILCKEVGGYIIITTEC